MQKPIRIWGIETNNLKNIDVKIETNSINLIIGPSGSGKSSLAYDTISQIGQHEYMSMFADNINEPLYKIKGYKNMLAAVPLKQTNYNNNIRSTIGTYFGINRYIVLIYAAILGLEDDFFVLNKEENVCEECHGLGIKNELDPNKIIDYNISLSKNPFRCWNRYKDFYSQIIQQFCLDNNIDSSMTFRDLSAQERTLVLYGESEKKYSVRYKKTASYSRRTTKYYGIMSGKPMLTNVSIPRRFYSEKICECCNGKKYSSKFDQYKVHNLSIGEFMKMPFDELKLHLELMLSEVQETSLVYLLNNIYNFVTQVTEFNLGYLFFHRTIPTLSGGELQRLRMVQVFNTQLSNLLLVLDEPLAGLSGEEKNKVYQCILELSKKHTLVLVDHSDIFFKDAKQIIALGEGSGNNGGSIIDPLKYIAQQNKYLTINSPEPIEFIGVKIDHQVYSYNGVDLMIGKDTMNLITGSSGVGKTTLIREYFPQFFEHYLYIDQKPLLGNKNSSVATALGIFNHISELFSEKYKKGKSFFSNQTGSEGACPVCKGSGSLEYGNGFDTNFNLKCHECNGTGFNKKLTKYTIYNKNIFEIWNMTVDEARMFFREIDQKIAFSLDNASSILVGHLKIGQPVSSLSGGENLRIKLLKSVKITTKVIGIDEPFKGLNNTEIFSIIKYLELLRSQGKTIIVVDHTELAKHYFPYQIDLVNKEGLLAAKIT